jgi:hypothetical protein
VQNYPPGGARSGVVFNEGESFGFHEGYFLSRASFLLRKSFFNSLIFSVIAKNSSSASLNVFLTALVCSVDPGSLSEFLSFLALLSA